MNSTQTLPAEMPATTVTPRDNILVLVEGLNLPWWYTSKEPSGPTHTYTEFVSVGYEWVTGIGFWDCWIWTTLSWFD